MSHRTLLGEICHINAASPRGPRYDKQQSDEERHDIANLILMCPTHHTEIDDNEDEWTALRLRKLKAEHEARTAAIDENDKDDALTLLVDQSINVEIGIAAHTVHAGSINFNAAPPSSEAHEKATQSVEILWDFVVGLKETFKEITFVDAVITAEELQSHFAHGGGGSILDCLLPYQRFETVGQKMEQFDGAERRRPFVSQRLYAIYCCIQGVLARAAILIHFSYERRAFQDWRADGGVRQHLQVVFEAASIDRMRSKVIGGLFEVVGSLEYMFLEEAERCRASPPGTRL